MNRADFWLGLLLRVSGGICCLAIIPFFMPRTWIQIGHEFMRLGSFPSAPIAEYLARSVSALCAFYGGLLIALSFDVHRFAPLIKYQAIAMMGLSAIGDYAGARAGLPAIWMAADAAGLWAFQLPILILVTCVSARSSEDRLAESKRGHRVPLA
jgi:hypothetical protein